jgi:hypothetical protein
MIRYPPRRQAVLLTCASIMVLLLLIIVADAQRPYPRRIGTQNKTPVTKSQNLGWYTFRGPDKDFILDFPTKPKRVEDAQGPVTLLRRYVSFTDNIYFEISIQDFGGAPDSPEANSYDPKFEQNLSQMLSRNGFRIVQIRRTAKNTYEMEAWAPSLTPDQYLHNLARGVLHNGRQYRMGCNSLTIAQDVDRSVCRRFFNSFHIVRAPQ